MNFVDEQHIALFQIGQLRREITRLRNHRPRRRAEIDPEFARHNLRQCGLAKPRGPDKQHMVKRILPRFRGFDKHLQIGPRRCLSHEIIEDQGSERRIEIILALFSIHQAGTCHFANSFNANRISADVPASSPSD